MEGHGTGGPVATCDGSGWSYEVVARHRTTVTAAMLLKPTCKLCLGQNGGCRCPDPQNCKNGASENCSSLNLCEHKEENV